MRWGLLVGGAATAGYLAGRSRLRRRNRRLLTGKVVLITGGSRGLGFILAHHLLKKGCRVVICGRDEATLNTAEQKLREFSPDVMTMPCDVSKPDEVARLVDATRERFGPVDILVNNAGILTVGPLDSLTRTDMEAAMDTMFWGTYNTTMAALPEMRARGVGQVVNIASVGGKVAVPHLLPYTAAKFAVVGFSEGLAEELAGDGITVTTVVPGLMRTGSYANASYKGQNRREYTWFAVLGNLPFTSANAVRAADRIVKAMENGESEVFITPMADMAARVHGSAPSLVTRVMGLANRVLPGQGGIGSESARGYESETPVTRSFATTLGRRAVRRFQHPNASRRSRAR